MTAVVVTANFGNHDTVRAPVDQDIDVEWHCYTDGDAEAPAPWRTHRVVGTTESNNLNAKLYKCCPPFTGDVIWIDASMEILSPHFAREALRSRSTAGVAAWNHPRRDCIYDEAEASVGKESQGGKYDGFDLAAQVASYRSEYYPVHNGLFGCGTIAWDLDNRIARMIGTEWYAECVRWSPQDQLSFPVVAWRHRAPVGVFPHPQIRKRPRTEPWPGYLQNVWMKIWQHDIEVVT